MNQSIDLMDDQHILLSRKPFGNKRPTKLETISAMAKKRMIERKKRRD